MGKTVRHINEAKRKAVLREYGIHNPKPDWHKHWPDSPGVGRFVKRQVSKARRKYVRMQLMGHPVRMSINVERECNFKTH